jgi:hypothetical protein
MTKILIPFVIIFLAFIVAKQYKPDSDLVTVKSILNKPIQIVDQIPREPVEYDKYRVIKPKYDTVSNQPLSSKTKKSMLSGGKIPYDFLNLRGDQTQEYMLGRSAY